jgi:endonuclease/exonuclease/phosphatase family metal-dependent hydrolase
MLPTLLFLALLQEPPPRAPRTLRVLSLNTWHEGSEVADGLDKLATLILASGADVVAMSEVRNKEGRDFHARLREALAAKGQAFHGTTAGGDVGLVSRWPVEKAEPAADFTAKDRGSIVAYHLRAPDGRPLLVASAHLDYTHYAVYPPRGYDGRTFKMIDADGDGRPDPKTDVQALHELDRASQRDDALRAFAAYVKERKLDGQPVVLAGDFNEASHLDWTACTADQQDHHGVVIEWANSLFLAREGYHDAWRERFPDPLKNPGSTWPSDAHGRGSTSWTPKADERDRIDYVYHNGRGLSVRGAWLVGSPRYYVRGERVEPATQDPFVLGTLPWPSDHKGVLVDFDLSR